MSPKFALALSLFLVILPLLCAAHGEEEEEHSGHGSTGTSSTSTAGHSGHSMIAYLHFTPLTDTIWFESWVPSTTGAVVGACIGLFLLGIVERWVEACGVVLAAATYNNHVTTKKNGEVSHTIPPFSLSNDLLRGAVHAVRVTLGFALMLVVMTFQAGFIMSIVAGLGVGEVLFGRYIWALGRGSGH